MSYNNYWGMNAIWCFASMIMLFWIFATPDGIPGQRKKKNSHLYLLQQRFALGKITKKEYQVKNKILENQLQIQENL